MSCMLTGPGLPKRLWFMAESDDENALDIAEPNWAAVALLYPAMVHNQDLNIKANISPLLLYNLNNDVQLLLKIINPDLNLIKVFAGSNQSQAFNYNEIKHTITGFSGGVDSTATYLKYNNLNSLSSLKISALSIYDVGAIGKTLSSPSFKQLQIHFDQLKKFCDEKELLAFGVSSNMDQVYRSAKKITSSDDHFFPTYVSLVNISATLAMQKRVRLYLPSGNIGYAEMELKALNTSEEVEPILAPLLSTERLICQVGAAGLKRYTKIKYIFENDPKSRLNVCVVKSSKRNSNYLNCGKCWKCILTMFSIEAVGKIDSVDKIFDLSEYINNKDELFETLSPKRENILPEMKECVSLIEAQGGKVPQILIDYPSESPNNEDNKTKKKNRRKKRFFW